MLPWLLTKVGLDEKLKLEALALHKKILELIPKTSVQALERCSGHDGTYGVKQETHKIAVKLARPIAKELNSKAYESFISDCTLAANHIVNVSGKNILPGHPISLLKKAYGIN